jgi:hypothetical protein
MSGFEPRELAVTSRRALPTLPPIPRIRGKVIFNVVGVYKKVEKSIGYILQPQPQCFYNNMSNLAQSDGLVEAGLCKSFGSDDFDLFEQNVTGSFYVGDSSCLEKEPPKNIKIPERILK